jgi:hypothetical protein
VAEKKDRSNWKRNLAKLAMRFGAPGEDHELDLAEGGAAEAAAKP